MNLDVRKLEVRYNDRTVGYLVRPDRATIAFQYDRGWQKKGFSISPFSLPLSDEVYISKGKNFEGLYGVFWDSLPDGWGELLVKRHLARHGVNYDHLSALTKLSLIGERGLGGLSYVPSQFAERGRESVDLDRLAGEIGEILAGTEEGDLDAVYRLGGSSGGARPKAHLMVDGEEWIVKFPCRIDPSNIGKREFDANQLAAKCGIQVNEHRLFPSSICDGYFGAKRFDRQNGKRLHVISLAALLETTHRIPNLDYGHLLRVTETLCDRAEMMEVFRRMCFNVIYGNKDDHSKNFAFLYDEARGGYALTPAYDLTQTLEKFEHEMTVNGAGDPTEQDLLALAEEFRLGRSECEKWLRWLKSNLHSC